MTIKGKDLIERISDKEYSEDLIKELEKYEVKKPKSVWELKKDDLVWVIRYDDVKGEYVSLDTRWHGCVGWSGLQTRGMVHLTKERAVLHARVLNTELAIKKWKRENDNVEIDWNDENQDKYHLLYYAKNGKIDLNWTRTLKFANTIYFSSESKTQQCINYIGEERIIEWLKWEDNDQ